VNKKPSVADIRAGYDVRKGSFDARFVFAPWVRRLSFYPTALFARWGISPIQTTWLSIALGVAGCAVMALGSYPCLLVGVLLVHGWYLADFVDGNLARWLKTPTRYGKFIDDFGGQLMESAIFFSLGVGLYRVPVYNLETVTGRFDPGVYLAAGGLTALWIPLMFAITVKYRDLFDPARPLEGGPDAPSGEARPGLGALVLRGHRNLASFMGLVMPILTITALLHATDLFVLLYCAVHGGTFLATTTRFVLKARATTSEDAAARSRAKHGQAAEV
jgi:hypothetical protein